MSYQNNQVNVTGAKTLADTDAGVVQNVTATATVTLPAAAAGKVYTIQNGAQGATAGTVTINVTPNGTDTVTGNGFTPASGKGAVNTLGQFGDSIVLHGATGTWYIARSSGTWTRQP